MSDGTSCAARYTVHPHAWEEGCWVVVSPPGGDDNDARFRGANAEENARTWAEIQTQRWENARKVAECRVHSTTVTVESDSAPDQLRPTRFVVRAYNKANEPLSFGIYMQATYTVSRMDDEAQAAFAAMTRARDEIGKTYPDNN